MQQLENDYSDAWYEKLLMDEVHNYTTTQYVDSKALNVQFVAADWICILLIVWLYEWRCVKANITQW